jgi:hypothetical protein
MAAINGLLECYRGLPVPIRDQPDDLLAFSARLDAEFAHWQALICEHETVGRLAQLVRALA